MVREKDILLYYPYQQFTHFIKLLDEEAIPYHRTGNRRKVNYTDVMAYKAEIDRKRLQSLDELSRLDQELGMGY